jgi:hypothetical protein
MTSTTRQADHVTLAASARGLTKANGRGEARVHALRGFDVDLPGRHSARSSSSPPSPDSSPLFSRPAAPPG